MGFENVANYLPHLLGVTTDESVDLVKRLGIFEYQHDVMVELVAVYQVLVYSLPHYIEANWLSDTPQVRLLLILWPFIPFFILKVSVLVLACHLFNHFIQESPSLLLPAVRAVVAILRLCTFRTALQHQVLDLFILQKQVTFGMVEKAAA